MELPAVSRVYKCDGCGDVWENASNPPRSWFTAEVNPNDNTGAIKGDFCTLNCLATRLANARLAQVIEEAGL